MEPRRILLANLPRFLREMLHRGLEAGPGLHIVGEVNDLNELPRLIAQTVPHWVIMLMPNEGGLPPGMEALLQTHQAVRVLAVTTDGSHVTARWLEPRERVLDGLSLDELRAVLRDDHPDQVPIQARFNPASAPRGSDPPSMSR